ncbi:hypothetical protein BaRGS_00013245 [Batillaria attramentaria]|uniref:AB hydrolase-1 domain-containing protein n=1 Tax=Batillaria attramentaria TaxID=370345 RepID=A0ABD0L870_9CAEN
MCSFPVLGIVAAVFAVVVALATFYPPPPLSTRLQAWKNRGSVMRYGEHDIFYIDVKGTGSKGVLVCLHGFPTFSWDWSKVLPGLEKEFSRVVLLDFLGYGFSDKPLSHSYTIGEQADIVERLTQKLSLKQAHLLSHDYGDTVALELLARHNAATQPESRSLPVLSVQSLTMLNGGVFPETNNPRPMQQLLLIPVLGPLLSRLTFFHLFKFGFGEIFGDTKPSEEEYLDFYAGLRHKNGHHVNPSLLQYIPERSKFKERWVGALTSTQVPVLMIYGPADPVNPPAFAEHFRKTVPQHRLEVLKTSIGHYPQWEEPESILHHLSHFIQHLNADSADATRQKRV